MTDLNLYGLNWKLFFKTFPIRWDYLLTNPKDWWAWVGLFIFQPFDVGLNTLLGGDGRESLSRRFYRRRNDSWIEGQVSRIANFLFHDDGPPEPPHHWDFGGEYELSRNAQGALAIFWLLVVPAIVGVISYV